MHHDGHHAGLLDDHAEPFAVELYDVGVRGFVAGPTGRQGVDDEQVGTDTRGRQFHEVLRVGQVEARSMWW